MPCTDKIITLKTGSTAAFSAIYRDAAGEPISLDGYIIDMDFISGKTGMLIKACSTTTGEIIISTDPIDPGAYTINAGDTSGWPIGIMPVDIKYSHSGNSQHTQDFSIDMILGRTA